MRVQEPRPESGHLSLEKKKRREFWSKYRREKMATKAGSMHLKI